MDESKSPLVFRVMRLSGQVPSRRPPTSLIWGRAGVEAKLMEKWEGEGVECGVGTFATLPSTFGNVYVGEQLYTCVNLYNRGELDVVLSRLKVDLELPDAQVVNLFELPQENVNNYVLSSENWLENVISVRLTQAGLHGIVCYAVFSDYRGESKPVKQVFRFTSFFPVKVALGRLPLPEEPHLSRSKFLLDFRLTSLMPYSMHFHSAELSAAPGVEAVDLNRNENDSAGDEKPDVFSVTDAGTCSEDVVSFMFLIDIKDPSVVRIDKGKLNLGKLGVSWTAQGGGSGRLSDIAAAVDSPKARDEVEVCISAVPTKIEAHVPFVAVFEVRNNTHNSIRLYLQVRRDKVGDVVPVGAAGKALGPVAGQSATTMYFSLLALSPGTHRLSGVRVVDLDSGNTYSADAPQVVAV
mmetsp:Transcript_25113/g.99025  ORF Transcript_25113/g.99025 Transcript_25113/m.99025 type:complete len:409 (-) Transcript_25113:1695-2921(-)